MIDKVQLKNWRSHLDSTLEFSLGTNVLLGSMGSGKSSVMNGICFGLFGTFPDLQSRKIKLNDLIMNKPSVKNESQIVVDFTVGEKTYSVMRVIERDKGTTYSEIRESDKLLDSPNAQRVTELIEKILKVNYELFSRAIYSEQNGLDYFLRLPKGERMKKIDSLLMIDKFEITRSNAVALKNKLIERKVARQSIVDIKDVNDLKKSLNDIDYSLNKLSETKDNLSVELKDKKNQKETLEDKIKEFEKFEQEVNVLKNRKNSIEGSMKEIESSIEKYEEILKNKKIVTLKEDLRDTIKFTETHQYKLNEKRKEQEILAKTISENEMKINFIKNEMREIENKIQEKIEINKKLSEIEKEFGKNIYEVLNEEKRKLEDNQKNITEFLTKLEQIKESLTKIAKTKDKCPVCESKISEERRSFLIKEYDDRITSYTKSLDENERILENKKRFILNLEKASRDFEIYSEKIKGLKDTKKQLEEKQRNYRTLIEVNSRKKQNLVKIKDEVFDIEITLEKSKEKQQELKLLVEKLIDFDEKRKRQHEFNEELEKINKQMLVYSRKFEEKNIKKIRQDFTEIVSRSSELLTRISGLKEIISEKEDRKKEYQEKIKQIQIQKEEIERLERLIKDIDIFEKSLEKTQTQLRENFIDTVNYTMDQIWADIYPYPDFISARLSIVERDYILQVQIRSGEWVDVDGIVSGGERSMASLVLRIAFSSVLAPQLKWLVLDEPTHNLDSKSVEDLSETLKTRVSDFTDQIFLITHEKTLENSVTGQLYRLSRNKDLDDFTKIERIN